MARPQKSTIVRTINIGRFALLRAAIGALERPAPSLTARWAARLWCTTPKSRSRLRDDRPGRGVIRTVTAPVGRIVTETWGIPATRPTVYLVHGWGGWRGQLGHFVEPLLDAGFRAIAFDVPGHGESGPGWLGPGRNTLVDFADALTAVATQHGPPAAVIAHSAGSAATALAIRDGLSVPRMGFVAPSADPLGRVDEFARTIGISQPTKERMLRHLQQLVDRPMSDFFLPPMAQVVKLPPTRIVHDRADKETPFAEALAIAEAWPEVEVSATDGLGHQRILRDPAAVQSLVDFVAEK